MSTSTLILLAGGLGTRLKTISGDLPKVLVPVRGVPFLHYVLKNAENRGIKKVILATGYGHNEIEKFFTTQSYNLEILFSREDKKLGTGGAIKKALDKCSEKKCFVMNADTLLGIDFSSVESNSLRLEEKDPIVVLSAIKVSDSARYGTVAIKDKKVTSFNEKTGTKVAGEISAGLYLLDKNKYLKYVQAKGECFSLEQEVFTNLASEGRLWAYQAGEKDFLDIGVPEDYLQIEEFLTRPSWAFLAKG